MYVKVTEVISAEIDEIAEQDCINYMLRLVIDRTYDGYTTEIKTVYGQLQQLIDYKIEPAPDEWDRGYNVDFFIKIANSYIGLQIKPASGVSHIPQIFKEKSLQKQTHEKFTEKYNGKVFYIISVKEDGKKKIHNIDVVQEIQEEIERLRK